ncbi:MAG: tRNA (adenosine(37)-N6)-dimethylallyltransferase MiaA [Bacteroidetes bacterium HGW-Bacteroidetes-7]|jgi:tRNA dimethylallyltransferase|nr:MAG: tRNA (adenosine(37)-N6)-dimethylallyltransferase MiaA [Bacteroidetes bacterium HGW-Bacteroidetes-7]
MSNQLICILGPTASGKTKFAVRVAAQTDGEIISADSRQVYRGMDIGTGKDLSEYSFSESPQNQIKKIPYHLIDIAEAGTKYNIFEYQRDFHKAYNQIINKGKQPILCGGSGLYIETATMGYSLPEVPPDFALRAELERESTVDLVKRLATMRQLHNTSDTESRKRLIRALEIAIYMEKHSINVASYPPIDTRYIGMLVSRDERIAKIDRRLDERLKEGLIEEVKELMESGITADDLIYYGLEYKYVTLYLTGQLSFETMRDRLAVAIHQFAKRQMTWFRGMERRGIIIEWVSPDSEIVL